MVPIFFFLGWQPEWTVTTSLYFRRGSVRNSDQSELFQTISTGIPCFLLADIFPKVVVVAVRVVGLSKCHFAVQR
jgi:hypothetical protein